MKYPLIMRIIHWAMAVNIVGLMVLGWYMASLTPEEGKYDLYDWHKAFGVLVIIFWLARVASRKTNEIPEMPKTIKKGERNLARYAHMGLYVFMFIVPFSGYIYTSSGGYSTPFFGLTVPNITGKIDWLFDLSAELHWILAYSFLALIALHIAAVLKHKFFEKKENNVLTRML